MIPFASARSLLCTFVVAGTISAIIAPAQSVNVAPAEISLEPVSSYNRTSVFFQVGLPVGKLLIRTEIGTGSCTGFLIAERYLITNEHCIADKPVDGEQDQQRTVPVVKVDLLLGYLDDADNGVQTEYSVVLPPVEANEDLDYAILEVLGNPSEKFGFLSISAAPATENMPLWIIGHPHGEPQQISRTFCKSATPPIFKKTRLRHSCGSKPGSSGSPVFDASTRHVIALHHAHLPHDKSGLAVLFSVIVPQSPFLQRLMGK